jgi:hypothetical protein
VGHHITLGDQTVSLSVLKVEAVADAVFSESSSGVRAQDEARHSRVLDATVDQAPVNMPSPMEASVSSTVSPSIATVIDKRPFVKAGIAELELGISAATKVMAEPFFGFLIPSIDMVKLRDFERRCVEEFTIGNRIEEARAACEGFEVNEYDLDAEFSDLKKCGAALQRCAVFADRLNYDYCALEEGRSLHLSATFWLCAPAVVLHRFQ